MSEEQRNHRRQKIQLAVRVRLDSIDQLIDEYAKDISISGMSLRLNQSVEVGEKIYLEFRILDDDPVISAFAEVKWFSELEGKNSAGVQFLDLDEKGKAFIEQVVVYINERRLYQRTPSNYQINIRSDSVSDFSRHYARDISTGGLKLIVDQPMKVGTGLSLKFQLQDGSRLINANSTVRWCEPHKEGFAVGLQFTDMDDDTKQFIKNNIGV